ncbi:hypothetical protein GGR28_003758 [Lewinella aquimaris]|uniref:Uncharacterized protein n=1 Tax=Neolewinella aquimaris TaxID=1835722 RepID=A0A840E7H8_9BACT|nr:hypothetical protein [Neolewinella aquimaris]MBB4081111.1 hypothetical protein [Neolewinella aquimaris]
MGNDAYIVFDYNPMWYEGFDEFTKEIDQSPDISIQYKASWLPAAAEGGETNITIFLNSDLLDFLKSLVVSGLLWDVIKVGTKRYILSPLFRALENLEKRRLKIGGLNVRTVQFQFADTIIIVGGISRNFTMTISHLFKEINKQLPKLSSRIGNVSKIETPIIENEGYFKERDGKYTFNIYADDDNADLDALNKFTKIWRIETGSGVDCYIFRLQNDDLESCWNS